MRRAAEWVEARLAAIGFQVHPSCSPIGFSPKLLPLAVLGKSYIKRQRVGLHPQDARVLESDAAPAVFAQWLHAPTGAPTMLLYAHADVQPATSGLPWRRHPFEPWVEDGAIFGRGAQASIARMR